MSPPPKAQVQVDEKARWTVAVPVPNRDKLAILVAESEDDAHAIASFVNDKLAAGNLFPPSH